MEGIKSVEAILGADTEIMIRRWNKRIIKNQMTGRIPKTPKDKMADGGTSDDSSRYDDWNPRVQEPQMNKPRRRHCLNVDRHL